MVMKNQHKEYIITCAFITVLCTIILTLILLAVLYPSLPDTPVRAVVTKVDECTNSPVTTVLAPDGLLYTRTGRVAEEGDTLLVILNPYGYWK